MSGHLTVIIGSMFSGKSTEIIRLINRWLADRPQQTIFNTTCKTGLTANCQRAMFAMMFL